jgi:hypothetical protein
MAMTDPWTALLPPAPAARDQDDLLQSGQVAVWTRQERRDQDLMSKVRTQRRSSESRIVPMAETKATRCIAAANHPNLVRHTYSAGRGLD